MLDGISKYLRLALAVFLGILLRAKNDGLASVHAVNSVYHLVQTLHLLELLSIDVEEILLNRGVCSDTHHDDTSLLVLIALTIDLLQHLVSRLDNGDGGTGGRNDQKLQLIEKMASIHQLQAQLSEERKNQQQWNEKEQEWEEKIDSLNKQLLTSTHTIIDLRQINGKIQQSLNNYKAKVEKLKESEAQLQNTVNAQDHQLKEKDKKLKRLSRNLVSHQKERQP